MTCAGSVIAIYITPTPAAPTQSVEQVRAVPGMGLEGDRYFGPAGEGHKRPGAGRAITLIEIEAIQALQSELGVPFTAAESRRNIVTQNVPLNHLVGQEFQIGQVRLRGVRLCEPCTHLADLTDPRVSSALVHRGGLRAEILNEGIIHVGDPIEF